MTGFPQFNFPLFSDAAHDLRYAGYTVISPHEEDDQAVQDAAWRSKDGDPSDLPAGKSGSDPVLTAVCNVEGVGRSDGLAVLPGWQKSAGSRHEVETAHRFGIPVAPFDLWAAAGGVVLS